MAVLALLVITTVDWPSSELAVEGAAVSVATVSVESVSWMGSDPDIVEDSTVSTAAGSMLVLVDSTRVSVGMM